MNLAVHSVLTTALCCRCTWAAVSSDPALLLHACSTFESYLRLNTADSCLPCQFSCCLLHHVVNVVYLLMVLDVGRCRPNERFVAVDLAVLEQPALTS
jgi:hypothetical protein